MSVTPTPPVLSNPATGMWPITLIIVVVIVWVPPALLNPTLGTMITLFALLLGSTQSVRAEGRSHSMHEARATAG